MMSQMQYEKKWEVVIKDWYLGEGMEIIVTNR